MVKKHGECSDMEKFKKFLKISCCVFLSLVLFCGMWLYYTASKVNEYITEKNIVYIPDKMALRFYHNFGFTDSEDYWILKPSKNDRKKIQEDILADKWSEIEIQHLNVISYTGLVEEHKPLQRALEGEEKYICVYDNLNNTIITNDEELCESSTTQWVIFIYNADKGLFCCIYFSI